MMMNLCIQGPLEYIPPVEVEVVTRRQAIPLHENEGIYVRNIKTGQVRNEKKNDDFFYARVAAFI